MINSPPIDNKLLHKGCSFEHSENINIAQLDEGPQGQAIYSSAVVLDGTMKYVLIFRFVDEERGRDEAWDGDKQKDGEPDIGYFYRLPTFFLRHRKPNDKWKYLAVSALEQLGMRDVRLKEINIINGEATPYLGRIKLAQALDTDPRKRIDVFAARAAGYSVVEGEPHGEYDYPVAHKVPALEGTGYVALWVPCDDLDDYLDATEYEAVGEYMKALRYSELRV